MLYKSTKTLRIKSDVNNVTLHKEFRKSESLVIKHRFYCKVINSFNKRIKQRMIDGDTSFTLPYLGTFGFAQLLAKDVYLKTGKPTVDNKKKVEYWLSQDELLLHEVDDSPFYVNAPKVVVMWAKNKSRPIEEIGLARCYAVRFDRDLFRGVSNNFQNGDIDLKIFNYKTV